MKSHLRGKQKIMKNDLLECEDFFALLKNLYEERLPFNKMLGIQVFNIGFDNLCVEAHTKPKIPIKTAIRQTQFFSPYPRLFRPNRKSTPDCLRPGVKTWLVDEVVLQEIIGVSSKRLLDKMSGFSLLEPNCFKKRSPLCLHIWDRKWFLLYSSSERLSWQLNVIPAKAGIHEV
jgi:hypothetical protein